LFAFFEGGQDGRVQPSLQKRARALPNEKTQRFLKSRNQWFLRNFLTVSRFVAYFSAAAKSRQGTDMQHALYRSRFTEETAFAYGFFFWGFRRPAAKGCTA
jgi:hypothetical protein